MKKYLYLVPIIMLIGTLISNFVIFDFVLIGNILGYSLLSNIILFHYFQRGKFCWLTRNAPLGLITINIIDILGCFIDYNYYNKIFNVGICTIILILALIFELKRRLKA